MPSPICHISYALEQERWRVLQAKTDKPLLNVEYYNYMHLIGRPTKLRIQLSLFAQKQ